MIAGQLTAKLSLFNQLYVKSILKNQDDYWKLKQPFQIINRFTWIF